MNNQLIASIASKYGSKVANAIVRRVAKIPGKTSWQIGGTWEDAPYSGDNRLVSTPVSDPIRLYNTETGQSLIVPCPRWVSDYGSIPSFVTKFAAKYGLRLGSKDFPRAYILHDAIYHAHRIIRVSADGKQTTCGISREQADSILAVALMARGSYSDGEGCASRAEAALIVEAVAVAGAMLWTRGPATDPYASEGWGDATPSDAPPSYGPVPALPTMSLDELMAKAQALGEAMESVKDVAGVVGKKSVPPPDKCVHASCWDGSNAQKRMMNILSPGFSDAKFDEYVAWMKGRGCDTAHVFLVNQSDGEGAAGQNCATKADHAKLAKKRIEKLRKEGFAVVPWIVADDSAAHIKDLFAHPEERIKALADAGLFDQASYIVIGLEMNEAKDAAKGWPKVAAALRKHYKGKLATHHTSGNSFAFAGLGEIVMGQLDPKKASVAAIKEQVGKIRAMGKDAVGFEYARSPDRKKAQAALDAGAIGCGNW